jgi:hypothetical protein
MIPLALTADLAVFAGVRIIGGGNAYRLLARKPAVPSPPAP